MGKLFYMHPSEDQLDLYAVGRLLPEHERLIEEHYLGCASCSERLSALADFITVLKAVRVDSPQLLHHQPSPAYTVTARLGVSEPKAEFYSLIHRRSILRIAAMLLVGIGTAILCNAPSPMRNPLHQVVVANVGTGASASPAKSIPSEVPTQPSYRRRLTLIRPSQSHRTFQPPPQPPAPLVAAVVFEIPPDSVIPSAWIWELESSLMVQLLEPPPLPPFHSKPHWFRRVLVAVRRSFEPPRW